MKRVFLLVLIPAFLLLTGFMAYFYAGGYRNAKQGFRTSLSDFIFLLHCQNLRKSGKPFPVPEPKGLEEILKRLAPIKHPEVREMAEWRISTALPDKIVPLLLQELISYSDRDILEGYYTFPHQLAVIWALGITGDQRAVKPLIDVFRHPVRDKTFWVDIDKRTNIREAALLAAC